MGHPPRCNLTCDNYNVSTGQCIIAPGTNQYLYDGEGRICAVNTTGGMMGYLYDADGNRVAKGPITAWSCDPAINGLTGGSETDYVLGRVAHP